MAETSAGQCKHAAEKLGFPLSSSWIRTLTNSWLTSARFGHTRPCHFCQQGRDELPHILQCPALVSAITGLSSHPVVHAWSHNPIPTMCFPSTDIDGDGVCWIAIFADTIHAAHRYSKNMGEVTHTGLQEAFHGRLRQLSARSALSRAMSRALVEATRCHN